MKNKNDELLYKQQEKQEPVFKVEEKREDEWVEVSRERFETQTNMEKQRFAMEQQQNQTANKQQSKTAMVGKERFEEGKSEELKSRITDYIKNTKTAKDGSFLTHAPSNSQFKKRFKDYFTGRLDEQKRREKMFNKKSRLYQKTLNADRVNEAEANIKEDFSYALELLNQNDHEELSREDFTDFAAFIDKQATVTENLDLCKALSNCDTNDDAAFDLINALTEKLFKIDISSINLETDTDIAKNAPMLEKIKAQVAAFDSITARHDLINRIDPEAAEEINTKLESLRTIAAYYSVKKEIMNDEYYRSHYNHELKKDTSPDMKADELNLTTKLLEADALSTLMTDFNKKGKKVKTKYRFRPLRDEKTEKTAEDFYKKVKSAEERKALKEGEKYGGLKILEFTVTDEKYAEKFSKKMTEASREVKKNRLNTVLYKKDQSSKEINEKENQENIKAYSLMKEAMKNRRLGCPGADFHTLAAFMTENAEENAKLLDLYIGKKKNEDGSVDGRDRNGAMEIAKKSILSIDISNIDLSEEGIVKNAGELEKVVNKVAAMDRMLSENKDYLNNLDAVQKETLTKRMSDLRAVAAYYNAKKDLINDDYYRSHENTELSMKIDKKSSDEQRAVAEKMMKAYLAENSLLKITGKKGKKELHLVNKEARDLLKKATEELSEEKQREYIEEAFRKSDYLVAGHRLDANNLKLTGGSDENLDALSAQRSVTYFEKHRPEMDRADKDIIEAELKERGIPMNVTVKNPLKGYNASGLNISRILGALTVDNSSDWGTDDIVNMLADVFELSKPKYQTMDKNSKEAEEANKVFERGIKQLKKFYLETMRRAVGTFGDIPDHLTYQDGKALMKNYGGVFIQPIRFLQDYSQLVENDKDGLYFDSKNKEDREYRALSSFLQGFDRGFSPTETNDRARQMAEMSSDGIEAEHCHNTKLAYSTDMTFIADEDFRKEFFKGPSFSERQMKNYKKDAASKLDKSDYEAYVDKVKVVDGGFIGALSIFSPKMMNTVFGDVRFERNVVQGIFDVIDINIKSAAYLEKDKRWQDPDSVKDPVLKQQILDAKHNTALLPLMRECAVLMDKRNSLKMDKNYGVKSKEYQEAKAASEEILKKITIAGYNPDEENE